MSRPKKVFANKSERLEHKAELVLRRVVYDHGCWLFKGGTDAYGYGIISNSLAGGTRLAHRALYIATKGDPGSRVLDHLCRNPACVNPDHLDPTTVTENVMRGAGTRPNNHCKFGHEYTQENTKMAKVNGKYGTRYKRVCLTCNAKWQDDYWARRESVPD